MFVSLITCQQFATVAFPRPQSAGEEVWQLVAGLEAIAIIILLVGWLTASRLKERICHQTSEEES